MRSPLPDSSVLEAGLVVDETSPKPTCVQDGVRALLRTPISMDCTTTGVCEEGIIIIDHPDIPPRHIRTLNLSHTHPMRVPEVMSRQVIPVKPIDEPKASSITPILEHDIDLEDQTFPILITRSDHRIKRRGGAWRHTRHGRVKVNIQAQMLMCVASSLFLGALLATYLSQIIDSPALPTGYNVIFILFLIAATIIFSHSVLRLLLIRQTRSFVHKPASSRRRHRLHTHIRPNPLVTDKSDFLTGSPIASPVEVPLHINNMQDIPNDCPFIPPTPPLPSITTAHVFRDHPDTEQRIQHPPLAYGRWRGSIRVDPAMLHLHLPSAPLTPQSPYSRPRHSASEDLSPPTYVSFFGQA